MKKLITFAAVAAAVCFTACTGNKTSNPSEPDSLCCDSAKQECCQEKGECPASEANNVVAKLTDLLAAGDAEGIKAVANEFAEKVAALIARGDEEAATKYAAVINNFVADNVDKLKNLGVASAFTDALANVQGLPAGITDIVSNAANGVKSDVLTNILNAVTGAKDAAQDAAEGAVSDVKDAAEGAVSDVKDAADAAVDAAAAKVEEGKAAAKDAASQAVDDAAAAAKKKLGL